MRKINVCVHEIQSNATINIMNISFIYDFLLWFFFPFYFILCFHFSSHPSPQSAQLNILKWFFKKKNEKKTTNPT